MNSRENRKVAMNPNDHIAKNFIWKECWSSKRVGPFTVQRAVEPSCYYIPNITRTADNAQIIRDRLNEVYGDNHRIRPRNRAGEIVVHSNSWWRADEFQHWLYIKGKSSTDESNHELGIAIDIRRVRGLTPMQFYLFVRDKCDTAFKGIGVYRWGLHLDLRDVETTWFRI